MKIFVANSGRCGSFFMSEIFRKLTTFPSFHEPKPRCTRKTLKYVNNSQRLISQYVEQELTNKIEQIENDSRDGNYFESSQMFIKSFKDIVRFNFNDVYIIYLWRNPIQVAMSYCKKKATQKHLYNSWHLQSHWDKNLMRTSCELSHYENILWECLEIKERFLQIKGHVKGYFEFDFKKLNDVDEWKRLFNLFGIEYRAFKKLPDVKKNDIREDFDKTYARLMKEWDESGEWDEASKGKYEKLDGMIDTGQRIMIQNERRLNAHALR